MITSIYIGTEKLDLFKDDNIELKSSIAEIQDVSKIFTDSTNSFSVPATDNNNRIFKHFYNSKLVNGWNVFNKVDSVIELSGFLYKQGKIKLNSVTTKSNKPTSYDIQYFGNLTALKDILKDDKLSGLDMSSYNFTYNATNVIDKLTTDHTSPQDIVNTTLSTRRMIYDSNSATNNTTDIKNVANNNTGFTSGLEWGFTGTSILNIRIIEAIETKYNLTFSRDYFGSTAFQNLYLLLNGSGVENEIEEQVVFDVFTGDPTLENDRILLSTNLAYSNTEYLRISISCQGTNKTDKFTSIIKSNGVEIHNVSANGNNSGLYVYLVKKSDYPIFENLTFHFRSSSILDYRYTVDRVYDLSPDLAYKSERNYNLLIGEFNVSNRMPDLKILDYLKGLFQMVKCIAENPNETEIKVETLQNFYRSGEVKEFTKYIDFKEIPISTGNIYSEINYRFKEPQTLLAKQFFTNNSVNYGDLEYKIVDANGNKVDGETIDIELPFENMVYEKILDLDGVDNSNFMYGYMADESLNPVNVKAHLHYVQNINTESPIKILTSSSSYVLKSTINVPIHTLGVDSPQFSTVFGEEFNEYNGVLIQNTLYTNYHKDFITNAFNENKRLYQFKAKNLPLHVVLNLKLNDVLLIKDEYYRINKYNTNLITKEISLECYNIKELNFTLIGDTTFDTTTTLWDTTLTTFDAL